MQITALGHSCVLLDLARSDGAGRARILVDPWLSDHCTGDGMSRFPRLRFETSALGPIDAVFLSHAHSDHLDPYTLVRLWRELETPPQLLLPVTLSFLLPVLRAHLPALDVQVLVPHEPTEVAGVEVFGLYDLGLEPTNEEDVMVLVVGNGQEVALVEADARLTLEHPELRSFVSEVLCAPGVETAVYLTTENELTGTLQGRLCGTVEERSEVVDRAVDEMLQAVQELYQPTDDPSDLFHAPHLLRLVHGQGLTAPHELDPRWQHILFPVRIAQRVDEERAAAERGGFALHIDALTPGSVHTVTAGRIERTEPLPGLVLLDDEADRTFHERSDFLPQLPCAPLSDDLRDPARQRQRIQALLDERFLPYLHGLRMPPVLHLLDGCGGQYRIRVHFAPDGSDASDYVLGYGARGFVEEPAGHGLPQEAYWAHDLEDVLDGRCDEFSPFCRTQLPAQAMTLWACLATPLLNSDLVRDRVALHFARAAAGEAPGAFVAPRYTDWDGGRTTA